MQSGNIEMEDLREDQKHKDDVYYPSLHIEGHVEGDGGSQQVINALHGQTKDQLLQGVQTFVKKHNLDEHENLFFKASLVAQNPAHYHNIDELSGEEKDALAYEQAHKWHGPFKLYFTGESSVS